MKTTLLLATLALAGCGFFLTPEQRAAVADAANAYTYSAGPAYVPSAQPYYVPPGNPITPAPAYTPQPVYVTPRAVVVQPGLPYIR